MSLVELLESTQHLARSRSLVFVEGHSEQSVYVGWWMCDCRTLTLSAVYMSSFNTHCRPSFNVHIMWAAIHCVSKYRPSVTFSNSSNSPCSISTNFRVSSVTAVIYNSTCSVWEIPGTEYQLRFSCGTHGRGNWTVILQWNKFSREM